MKKQIEHLYIKHTYNARHGNKILDLRAKFGMKGYGYYWAFVEKIAESTSCSINYQKLDRLVMDFGNVSLKELQEILDFCIKIDLFVKEQDLVSCYWVKEHHEEMMTIQKKRSFAGKQSGKSRRKKTVSVENNEQKTSKCSTENEQVLNTCSTNVKQVLNTCSTSVEHTANTCRTEKRREEKRKEENKENFIKEKSSSKNNNSAISNISDNIDDNGFQIEDKCSGKKSKHPGLEAIKIFFKNNFLKDCDEIDIYAIAEDFSLWLESKSGITNWRAAAKRHYNHGRTLPRFSRKENLGEDGQSAAPKYSEAYYCDVCYELAEDCKCKVPADKIIKYRDEHIKWIVQPSGRTFKQWADDTVIELLYCPTCGKRSTGIKDVQFCDCVGNEKKIAAQWKIIKTIKSN